MKKENKRVLNTSTTLDKLIDNNKPFFFDFSYLILLLKTLLTQVNDTTQIDLVTKKKKE